MEPQSGVHGPMRPELDCCGANEVGLSLCTQTISVRNAFQPGLGISLLSISNTKTNTKTN